LPEPRGGRSAGQRWSDAELGSFSVWQQQQPPPPGAPFALTPNAPHLQKSGQATIVAANKMESARRSILAIRA